MILNFEYEEVYMKKKITDLIEERKIEEALQIADKDDIDDLNKIGAKFAQNNDLLALQFFNKIIKLNKNNASAHFNRGNFFRELNLQKKAIKDYTKAIKLNPHHNGAYINRGNAYTSLKLYSKAINDYHIALNINPNDVLALKNLTTVEKKMALSKDSKSKYINNWRIFNSKNGLQNRKNLLFKALKIFLTCSIFLSFFLIILLPFSIPTNFVITILVMFLCVFLLFTFFPDDDLDIGDSWKERAVIVFISVSLMAILIYSIITFFGPKLGEQIITFIVIILISYSASHYSRK